VKTIKFRGLHKVSENAVTVFKLVELPEDFPLPTMIKEAHPGDPSDETPPDLVETAAQAWYGEEVGGVGGKTAILMSDGEGNLLGTISDDEYTYDIRTTASLGNGRSTKFDAVLLTDLPSEEGDTVDLQSRRLASSFLRGGTSSLGHQTGDRELQSTQYVDVMVVYTTEAVNYFNYFYQTRNQISLGIFQTNVALWSSGGTNKILRLVASYWAFEIADNTSKTSVDYLREVQSMYESYGNQLGLGADLVHLIYRYSSDSGRANIGGRFGVSKADPAFRAGQYTFAHEIGHNLGARHLRDSANTHSYAAAYCAGGYRTLLAYNSCPG
jgi:Metallo-peptidase family M12